MSTKKLFTKSAFKQALHCPASLYYYYDSNYANQNNEDDFLQALAEGGQQAGDLAKLYYRIEPDCDIKTLKYEEALSRTEELFKREDVTIAEAAFKSGNCFIRADIIKKNGKKINLIEVKAKSWEKGKDFFNKSGAVDTDIREYVYDVAFQKYVIQNALGTEYTVNAYLMLADKTIASDAPDGVNQFFEIVKADDTIHGKGKVTVNRKPNADSLLKYKHVLQEFDVNEVCQKVLDGKTSEQKDEKKPYLGGYVFKDFVKVMSEQYVKHERHFSALGGKCFKCPFFSNEKTPGKMDGKRECWTEKAKFKEKDFSRSSVGDLWGGQIGNRSLRDELVKKKKYFLEQVKEEDIRPGTSKKYAGLSPLERRLLQIGLTTGNDDLLKPYEKNLHKDPLNNKYYLDVEGLRELKKQEKWEYPYHMIDFETTAVALPLYKGMHPYEQVAFQFSHHIIKEDGTIIHSGQYLNTEKHHFPNFDFIRELKSQLEEDNGTIFRYATHENTILRAIRKQLEESKVSDRKDLEDFIDSITYVGKGDKKNHGERDMVDLLEVVKGYYYHPDMKGSNSIKAVLPAILNSSKAIREKYSKPIYGTEIESKNYRNGETVTWIDLGPDGKVANPYKELKPIADFLGVTENELAEYDREKAEKEAEDSSSIANGGAALAAYTKLQFSDDTMTEALKQALYRYCELDTMSMVFIWEFFHEMLNK